MVNFYDNGQTGGYTGPGIPDVTRVVNPRQPATNNYLASNFFNLEITRLPTVTYFCQSVGIPSLNLTPVDQPTPMGVYPKFIGGRYTFEDLTVNFIGGGIFSFISQQIKAGVYSRNKASKIK